MKNTQKHYSSNQMNLVCLSGLLNGSLPLKSLNKLIPAGCSHTLLMNDGVILTHTCRQVLKVKVRQVVQNMHDTVRGLKPRLALMKTFIGRIGNGFDFLGYRFGALSLTGLAQQPIDNHKQKLFQLNELSASNQRVEK